jgi:hypothetical protein
MSPDPANSAAAPCAERRPAVWPWLLLPLVVLIMFFLLRAVMPGPGPSDQAVEAAPNPSEAAGSR